MYRKLWNIAAVLFTISAVGYGASTLVSPPVPTVVSEKTATAFQAGGWTQDPLIFGTQPFCHFTISGVPGAGTYVARGEPCEHSSFLVGATLEHSLRQFRTILRGPGGAYTIALAFRSCDTFGNVNWTGVVYGTDGMYSCSCNGTGAFMVLSGSDYNCSGSAPWGGDCNSAGGNVTLNVSP